MTLTYLMLVGLRQLEDLDLMAEEAGFEPAVGY